jgi:hypothetical protein
MLNLAVRKERLINGDVNMMGGSTTLRCWRTLSNEIAFINPSAFVGLY